MERECGEDETGVCIAFCSDGSVREGYGDVLVHVRNMLSLLHPSSTGRVRVTGKGSDPEMSKTASRILKGQGFKGTPHGVYFVGDTD